MSNFKMIDKLGLGLFTIEQGVVYGIVDHEKERFLLREQYVRASDLEKLLSEAKVVYGRVDGNYGWTDEATTGKDHSALLIGIEEISKQVTKSEVCEALRVEAKAHSLMGSLSHLKELADRIEKHGIQD